jgi:trk system potassium uptake protein TrkA
MNVLIVGGGLTGSFLAGELVADGQVVTVVEKRAETADALQEMMPSIRVFAGDGDDPTVLEKGGVRSTDVLVASTGEDEDNLVACLLARFEFNVPRTLARVNNPRNEWLFSATMGVDRWVSQAHVMADLMREEVRRSL